MDWNAWKAACHQAAIWRRLDDMKSWEDDRLAELREAFPAWDVWYVRAPTIRRHTWCARPKGAPVAIFHAWDSAELAAKLTVAEAQASGSQETF